jgi:exonuclease VII small subunit
LSEYKDAIKRFKVVHKRIQALAMPPNRSIFDSSLRDELLFENNKFTYSRRYFWASQTLGLLSNEIKDITVAYNDTFTDEFWTGEHKTLFPGTKDQSPRYNNWRKKLTHTRRLFEKEIAQLEEVFRIFQDLQKQIKNCREWLFSGTSVLESREAVSMAKITVEQGYNIRLLTLVTLFYLPLSFVTGIYGSTWYRIRIIQLHRC